MNQFAIVMCERVEPSETIGDVHLYRELDSFYGVHREQSQLPVEDIQRDNIFKAGPFKELVGSAAMPICLSERIEISAEPVVSHTFQKVPCQLPVLKGHTPAAEKIHLFVDGFPGLRIFGHGQKKYGKREMHGSSW